MWKDLTSRKVGFVEHQEMIAIAWCHLEQQLQLQAIMQWSVFGMLKARPGNVMNKDTYDILFVVRMSYWKGCIKERAGTHKNKFYHLSPTNLLQLGACQNWLLI
jgi:hypothetical protein